MDPRSRWMLWLFVIFITAIATRAYLVKYTYIFGFDSYWFARMASYIVRYGSLPYKDPIAWWGAQDKLHPLSPSLAMFWPAWIYIILYGHAYDPMKLLGILKWLPAIFGAIGSVGNALLVYAVAGPFAGALAGWFAATNPAYIYRTMSGFYEDDASSLWIPLSVFFAFLAYGESDRKKKVLYVLLSGLALLLGAMSWVGTIIVSYAWFVYLGLLLVLFLVKKARDYIPVPEHAQLVAGIVLALVLAGIGYFILYTYSYRAAGQAYAFMAGLPGTTSQMLITPPWIPLLYALFSFFLLAFLENKDRNHLYAALASLLLVVAVCFSVKSAPITIRTPDGTDVNLTLRTNPGTLFFGSAIYALAGMLSGWVAWLFVRRRASVGKKHAYFAGIVFAAIALSLLTYFFNGMDMLGITRFISKGAETFFAPQSTSVIAATVGEETHGFQNWPAKYGLLAFLVFLSVPFLARKAEDPRYLFLLAWLIVGWYTAWAKLKFTYYLGLPVAFAVAIMLDDWRKWFEGRFERRFVYGAFVLFLGLSILSTGVFHTVSRIPSLLTDAEAKEMALFGASSAQDYIDTFQWINEHLPRDAAILNWWNMGHWLAFFTERRIMTDNTNAVWKSDVDSARFFLSDEENAYKIAKEYDMNYVFFESSYFLRAGSFAVYAFETARRDDPRLVIYQPFIVQCKRVRGFTGYVYACPVGGTTITIDENKWNAIPPFSPLTYLDSNHAYKLTLQTNAGPMTMVAYRMDSRLVLMSPQLNDAVVTKMFLCVPGACPLKHFKLEYVSPHGNVKIFKIE